LLLGLFGLARGLRLGALGSKRLALGAARRDRRVVMPRLRLELIQEIFPRLLRRLLPVCEAGFLESTHRTSLVFFTFNITSMFTGTRAARNRRRARRTSVYIPARSEATQNRSRSDTRKSLQLRSFVVRKNCRIVISLTREHGRGT